MAARVRSVRVPGLVARLGCLRARVVFPTMAGPLAGPVLGGGVVAVLAPCPWSRLARVRLVIRRRVRARRPGRRRVLSKEIEAVKHGDA